MPRISEALNLDAEKRDKWRTISENLAPYPKGTVRDIQNNPTLWKEVDVKLEELLPEELLDTEIFYDEGIGGKWSFHFPGNIMQIYPGSAIGLGSIPEELEVARNTVHIHAMAENALGKYEYEKECRKTGTVPEKNQHFYKAGAFNASNLSCLFFTAAVRVGYDPDIIWNEMKDMILQRGLPNGFLKENPHGIEQLNTVTDAIQEMMMQSYEGIIRIFPVWPRKNHPNAYFRGFRAWGGFEVDAGLKNGVIEQVTVLSHKGHICKIENPWPGKPVKIVYEFGRDDEICSGKVISINLHKEEKAILTEEGKVQ